MTTATIETQAITGAQKAYKYARSGIARSGASRSNYVAPWTRVDLIVRDEYGNITAQTDLTKYIRYGSLHVTEALNDEPDTCSFQIVPDAPASAVPKVGQEIQVSWTPGVTEFRGFALVVQYDRREMNQSPWVAVQCQDAMWRFDARIVTYRFPAASVTDTIGFLVATFCNRPPGSLPTDFTTTFVQAGMPSLPSFDIVNQRPSTIMRRIMAAVGGAFYVDGRDLHAWAGSLTEPGQTNPQPLTNTLATLKHFRLTQDATQVRKRVLVEGRRASTLIPYPTLAFLGGSIGLPVTDATIFPPPAPNTTYLARIGSQWMKVQNPVVVSPTGANPPQARVQLAYTPGQGQLFLKATPSPPPVASWTGPIGWVRVAGQLAYYTSIQGNPAVDGWSLILATTGPYGVLTVPVPVDEPVEWVDGFMGLGSRGLQWDVDAQTGKPGDETRGHPADTPVVTLTEAHRGAFPWGGWPALEGFVQDGRYSYDGALARANADLDAFAEPILTPEWETDDLNAQPGRQQVINLTGSSVMDPVSMTVTITRVELTFPLRSQPPRRQVTGGRLKESTFLDLVLTDES